ncbi:MAG TPA: sigma 54-interacting transcriptional regulator [Kofleriaceae bacterium]|nr:sigma 54-interacting transcriptional regulator [Kofleriaceae bacterium]
MTTKLLPVTGEVTIGRSSTCDLMISHISVSRHHATLRVSPLQITDHGSRNGTRIRGRALPSGTATAISAGDAIQIGDAAILLQPVMMSFDGKPLVEPVLRTEGTVQALDTECARSARTGSPFALIQIATEQGKPKDIVALLRGFLRTTDIVRGDSTGGFSVLLPDTADVTIAVARLRDLLRQHGIAARFGAARYPDDGVSPEQLLAYAFEELAREPDADPTPMDTVRALVGSVAGGELSVLINGETGVGKELCAEMIHRLSPRAKKPFVKLNCSALVESLIESELFGHERGAFTGATSAHPGLLDTGNGGTVFLDEIGELPVGVQAKLLRVLEERVVRPVGATTGKKVDVRFIFATNRDLVEEVNAGRFRRDLYYRMNGVTILIPPLRERRGEIAALARAFADRARPGVPLMLGKEVVAALEHHSWPGNIRELRNTIERAVLLSSGGAIRPAHLVLERDSPPAVRDSQPTMPVERLSSDSLTLERPAIRQSSQSLASEVADLERQRILQALEECGGNQSRAAKLLGMSRNTLLSRLDEYGLPRPRKA